MRYFLALFLALSFIPSVVKADLIPDNSHPITNCVSVENIGEYSEYDFVWQRSYRFEWTQKITNADMTCGHAGGYSLYAIQKSDWDKVTYPQEDPDCPECGTEANWIDEPKNAGLFIPSNYSLSLATSVPDTDSAVKRSVTVHIDSVSSAGVTAHTATTVTTDTEDNTLTDAKGSLSTLAIVLVAVGVLGVGAMLYTWKKK